jgi:T5SS/PEP-CTERM-associated repeat protein/autotransporter-associated beta strand protein
MITPQPARKPAFALASNSPLEKPLDGSGRRSSRFHFFPARTIRALLAAAFLLTASSAAHCATESWNPNGNGTGGNGTWDTGVTPDWDSGVVWTDSNDALFSGAGGTVTVVSPIANSLTFSATGPYTLTGGTLTMSGSDITVNSAATIGSDITAGNGALINGTSVLTLTGSDNFGSNVTILNSQSDLTINSGTVAVAGGGSITDIIASIGDASGSSAAVTMSGAGSIWNNESTLLAGDYGSGTLSISNGASFSGSEGSVLTGYEGGASGVIHVTGIGSTLQSENVYAGYSGTGTLLISGGASASISFTVAGYVAGSSGTITVTGSGSTFTNSDPNGYLDIGDFGSGALLISNGGSVSASYSYIGNSPGSSGTAMVTGSNSTWTTADDLDIGGGFFGDGGSGVLSIENGGSVIAQSISVDPAGTLALGHNATLLGTLSVSGSGTVTLVDGQLETVTLTSPVSLSSGSVLDFEVGAGSDQIAFAGSGALSMSGTSVVNLYGLSSAVASGTDVVIGASPGGSGGSVSLGNVYNTGNFTYALRDTGTSEDVIVTPANANLTTAYWTGKQSNIWSVAVGGTATNWSTNSAGTIDSGLTPSATTNVIFSANTAANQGNTILGTDMTIDSLTISDTNAVGISGSDSDPLVPSNDTLTITGSNAGQNAITVDAGAGAVTIGANLSLSDRGIVTGIITVNNAAGLLLGGTFSAAGPIVLSGTGTLTLAGPGSIAAGLETDIGTLVIENTLTGDSALIAGQSSAAVMVTGSGAAWTNSGALYIGESGTGSLVISGGGMVSDLDSYIGNNSSSIGNVTVTGSGSTWTNSGELYIGETGTGSLAITNGAMVSSSGGSIIGDQTGSIGIATVSGSGGASTWTDSGDLIVGGSGTGTMKVSLGGAVSDVNGWIGYAPGSSGLAGVSGSGSAWTNSATLYVGESGTGTLNVLNGATVSTGSGAIIGDQAGSRGVVLVTGSGSTWTEGGDLDVGNSGRGTLVLTNGGRVAVQDTTTIGSTGILEFDGSSTFDTGSLVVNGGTLVALGAVDFTDSATVDAGGMNVEANGFDSTFSGNFSGPGGIIDKGPGTLTLTGSSDLESDFLIAHSGAVRISGGGYVSDSTGAIGYGSGAMTVSGSGSTWTNTQNLLIGHSGTGTLTVTDGGAVLASGNSCIGSIGGSTGAVTVSGSGDWSTTHNLAVGYSGTGTLSITTGGTVSDATGYVGFNASSNGTATVSGTGSAWTNTGGLSIGHSAPGTLTIQNGGLVSVSGTTLIGSQGTLEFDGASMFNTGSLIVNGGTLVTLSGATFSPSAVLGAGGLNINANRFNSTFSGNLHGIGGIAISGTGAVTLTGASNYTGATSVTSGTLALTTGPLHTATLGNTAISVASEATFSPTLGASHFNKLVNAGTTGAGSAGAALTLNPGSALSMAGASIGVFQLLQENAFSGPAFTIGGATGIAPSLTFDIGNAATGPDSIDVTKTVTVLATGGKITIDALAGDTSLTAGNYDLITSAGGFSGTGGNGLTLTDTTLVVNGDTYDLSLANSTADDEVLTVSAAAVPGDESRPFAYREDAKADVLGSSHASAPLVGTTAVPEPENWASGIAALAVMLLLSRRPRGRKCS